MLEVRKQGAVLAQGACHHVWVGVGDHHEQGCGKGEENTQTNNLRDKKGDITTNTNEIQRIIRKYFENLHSNK
jgi:hypothetical protein